MNNGALILKSKNRLNSNVLSVDFEAYKKRVIADGGHIVNEQATKDAINFASSIGITKDNDAGIVSPAWGIKHLSGGYYTLYSLFADDKDYFVAIATGELGNTDGKHTINLMPTTGNSIRTDKGFNANQSIIALNINKPPILATAVSYGNVATQFGQIKVYKEDSNNTSYDSVIDLYYERSSVDKMPAEWGSTLSVARIDPNHQDLGRTAIPNVKASKFSSMAVYIDANKVNVFDNGSTVFLRNFSTTSPIEGVYKAEFARRFLDNNASKFIAPLASNIAEMWTITGGTEEMAQQLSGRANKIYNAA